jgi:four helix bundle protein
MVLLKVSKGRSFWTDFSNSASAVSIPSNIAEGYGRNSTGDYARFLQIASGSLYEFQTQLEISFQLGYLITNVLMK